MVLIRTDYTILFSRILKFQKLKIHFPRGPIEDYKILRFIFEGEAISKFYFMFIEDSF